MRATLAAAATAAVVVAALLLGPLTQRAPRLESSNQHPNRGGVVFLQPGQEACQPNEDLPRKSPAAVVNLGSEAPAGPLVMRFVSAGREIARGRTGSGLRTSTLAIPLSKRSAESIGVEACIRNAGRVPVSLGGTLAGAARDPRGTLPGLENPAVTDGVAQSGRFRLEYRLPGEPTNLAMAGRVATRVGLLKGSWVGSWAMWFALLVPMLSAAVAVAALARGESR